MNYRSIQDLNASILKNLHKVPIHVDLIVGVPRSGLLAANLLSQYLNLPLADVESFKARRLLFESAGTRHSPGGFGELQHALVLDDSIGTGGTLRAVKDELRACDGGKSLLFAAVFAHPDAAGELDFHFEDCPLPRLFEWNMMHQAILGNACVDIDGVLCRDPEFHEIDDGKMYESFLAGAERLLPCSETIRCLVTNRLEKHRSQTEAWLDAHGIIYRDLIMRSCASQTQLRKEKNYGGFKADVYLKHPECVLFIESSYSQARDIAAISGKAVFCVETGGMIDVGAGDRDATIVRAHAGGRLRVARFLPVGIKRMIREIAK